MNGGDEQPTGVLFVCFANVCRSPMAEGIFRHLVAKQGVADQFEIDSAGTSAMEGSQPHPSTIAVTRERDIPVSGIARQLVRPDLMRFDHIVLMDRFNRQQLSRMAGPAVLRPDSGLRARIRLLREIADPDARDDELDVPDPVNEEIEAYEKCFELIHEGCAALLEETLAARS